MRAGAGGLVLPWAHSNKWPARPSWFCTFRRRSVPAAVGLNYLICMSHFAADRDGVPVWGSCNVKNAYWRATDTARQRLRHGSSGTKPRTRSQGDAGVGFGSGGLQVGLSTVVAGGIEPASKRASFCAAPSKGRGDSRARQINFWLA